MQDYTDIRHLPIRSIIIDENMQVRHKIDEEYIDRLSHVDPDDLPPIQVRANSAGDYTLVHGEHRLRAMDKGKQTLIKSEIVPYASKSVAYEQNLRNGLPLTKEEIRDYVKYLHYTNPGMSMYEIAKKALITQPTVKKILSSQDGQTLTGNVYKSTLEKDARKLVDLLYGTDLFKLGEDGHSSVYLTEKAIQAMKNRISQYPNEYKDAFKDTLQIVGTMLLELSK